MITCKAQRVQARLPAMLTSLLGLTACTESLQPVAIEFTPELAGEVLYCSRDVGEVALTDLRLYIHGVELINDDGKSLTVQVTNDGRWQKDGLVLLDFEDGSGNCLNGTTATNTIVRGQITAGDYRGLRFTVGVPFDRNHGDPLKASAPLGDSAMHWSWRGGYKFFRAGVATADDSYWLHLGSTGCVGRINSIESCKNPNRVSVELDEFVPGISRVSIDLAELVQGTDLTDATPASCSSGPAEVTCPDAFLVFGLDFESGLATGPQRIFESHGPE